MTGQSGHHSTEGTNSLSEVEKQNKKNNLLDDGDNTRTQVSSTVSILLFTLPTFSFNVIEDSYKILPFIINFIQEI